MTTRHAFIRIAAQAGAAALAASTSVAAMAHTGHGHEELSFFAGWLHALREPDHLAMLALGIVVTGALAPVVPRVLRAGRAATRLLGRALAAQPRLRLAIVRRAAPCANPAVRGD